MNGASTKIGGRGKYRAVDTDVDVGPPALVTIVTRRSPIHTSQGIKGLYAYVHLDFINY